MRRSLICSLYLQRAGQDWVGSVGAGSLGGGVNRMFLITGSTCLCEWHVHIFNSVHFPSHLPSHAQSATPLPLLSTCSSPPSTLQRGGEGGEREEGEEMDDMIRHIVQCSPLRVLHRP